MAITGKEEVQRRWREHFSELFQNEGKDHAGVTWGDESSNEIDNRILMEETRRSIEARRAIWKLRSGKAEGECDI